MGDRVPGDRVPAGPELSDDDRDRLIHDAEHAEAGAAVARAMKDDVSAIRLAEKAKALREQARPKPDKTLPGGSAADTEASILESLANPMHRKLTIEQRCELIGISRRTWHRHLADPLFKTRASKAYRDACGDALGPVLDALVESAKLHGKEGHADRKLFLELLGEYVPGQGGADEESKRPGHRLSDDELLACFADKMHLVPVGVLRRLGKDPDAAADRKEAA